MSWEQKEPKLAQRKMTPPHGLLGRGEGEVRNLSGVGLGAFGPQPYPRKPSKPLNPLREQAREQGTLKEELNQLFRTIGELQTSTAELAGALKTPIPRGRWAEIQLQRLVELSGMQEHVDVEFQASLSEGSRPDMRIHLPNGRRIAVDAKAPMDAYLRALEALDEGERKGYLEKHARALKEHIRALSGKEYWRSLGLELVVMYIPGEPILSAAFEGDQDGNLMDFAFQHHVLPATPVIFLALLKAIAHGWKEHQTLENAQKIIEYSEELFVRINKFIEHLLELGKELRQAVEEYNKTLGSFEWRVAPTLRKIRELRGIPGDIRLPKRIEEMPRTALDLPNSGKSAEMDADGSSSATR